MENTKILEWQVNLVEEQRVDNNWLPSQKQERQNQISVLANLTQPTGNHRKRGPRERASTPFGVC